MQTTFSWLNQPLSEALPVTFGAPWARKVLSRTDHLCLEDSSGQKIPAQFKPIAFWPDGSVKWTAISTVAPSNIHLVVKTTDAEDELSSRISAMASEASIQIHSDQIHCVLTTGTTPIASLFSTSLCSDGSDAGTGRFLSYLEREESLPGVTTHKDYELVGNVQKLTLEEKGPIRVVVKLEGVHVPLCKNAGSVQGDNPPDEKPLKDSYFPFWIRMYFYAGSSEIKITHTLGIDLDETTDLLKGLCLELSVPSSGKLYNRHVGYVGEEGMFYEASQLMYKGGNIWNKINASTKATTPEACQAFYDHQVRDGQFVTLDPEDNADFIELVEDNASWNRFILDQSSPDSYQIVKQTKPGCGIIHACYGNRSNGCVFYGNPSYILAASIGDFWEKAPRALEVDQVNEDRTQLKIWLYSMYDRPYDFRAYDTVSHQYSYGGINNVPEGICNTNDIYLKLYDQMPGKEAVIQFAKDRQNDVLPVADPSVYQETGVFGTYWLPGIANESVETAVNELCNFYIDQAQIHRWYGFWDYGDVRHTYDPTRHCWRYDVGGFAWHNTEMTNTYMHWLGFLRSGDPALFHMASRMTRHCSEVDIYHFGPLKGLGSRHNVRHWGCSAKEPRISMAGHNRFYYYLTADERIGDIMDQIAADADRASAAYDIMGITYFGKHEDPRYSHMRTGPDWFSFVSNWMTAWERHEDLQAKSYILAGLHSIAKAPLHLASGSTFHYDLETKEMLYMAEPSRVGHTHPGDGNYHMGMVVFFAGPEVLFELADLLEDDQLEKMLSELGDIAAMTPQERIEATHGLLNQDNMFSWASADGLTYLRMLAYAALHGNQQARIRPQQLLHIDENPNLADEFGLSNILDSSFHMILQKVEGPDVLRPLTEAPSIFKTNTAAQGSLNLLEVSRFLSGKK